MSACVDEDGVGERKCSASRAEAPPLAVFSAYTKLNMIVIKKQIYLGTFIENNLRNDCNLPAQRAMKSSAVKRVGIVL